jgi:hypothetical protein
MNEPVRNRSSPVLATLFVVVTLAILYPLSAGPASWFFQHGHFPSSAMVAADWFYGPIDWVSLNSRFFDDNPIGQAYARYIEWWND